MPPSGQSPTLQKSLTFRLPPLPHPSLWPRTLSNLAFSNRSHLSSPLSKNPSPRTLPNLPFSRPAHLSSPVSRKPSTSTRNDSINGYSTSQSAKRGKSCCSQVQIDWSAGEKSGLVSIGSHSLCLYASGRDRKPGEPVVVVIQGLTHSCKGWAAVQCLLKPVVRTYLYDRSGCGQSYESPQKPTSTAIAAELDLLLKNADVGGPFIVVAHSWGGVLSREFFHLRGGDVAGLVLVDANQERTLQILDWRNSSMWAVAGAVDYLDGIGARREHKLTDSEWAAFIEDEANPKHRKQAEAENLEYDKSFPILAAKEQLHRNPPLLGDRPVCLILGHTNRDYKRLYVEGVKAGAGSEEGRAISRRFLETFHEKDRQLQLEALSLSRTSWIFIAEESGHNVHLTNPEVIVEGVKWVLSQFHS